jgi:mannose-6-phosphate isomerase-like protein (cupin superfamily)
MSTPQRDEHCVPSPVPADARVPAGAAFPGATGLTVLDVYDWTAPDGLRGGSAHVHLASTEGYLVLSGAGSLQTLSERGYAATPLRPGDCVWFTPGTIHRLVNDDGLRLAIVMQNAGLPEHGDAVLTFAPDILADPDRYARAASLGPFPGDPAVAGQTRADRARRRASLAVAGYLQLRAQVAERGPGALEGFYAQALRLVAGRAPEWRERWQAGALGTAELTGEHLDNIASEVSGHLASAGVWGIAAPTSVPPDSSTGYSSTAYSTIADGGNAHGDNRGARAPDTRAYGMCGRLTTYPATRAARLA